MGGFWEVCFLRKAQEPRHPKPGFPGFRASALHSSATLPNGSAALPILAAGKACASSRTVNQINYCQFFIFIFFRQIDIKSQASF